MPIRAKHTGDSFLHNNYMDSTHIWPPALRLPYVPWRDSQAFPGFRMFAAYAQLKRARNGGGLEPRLLSRYIIYISVHRYCACAALRANVAGQISGIDSVQLSQHFGTMGNAVMMIWDFKREGDVLFRHLQGS